MEEHWNESPKDIAKNMTIRKQRNKEHSKALDVRLDWQEGVHVDDFYVKMKSWS
jgi:hypothetical protein